MIIFDKLYKDFPALYEAALNEFSVNSYEKASLNKILLNSGMSKGSFYYNIKGKYTLYLMLLSAVASKKARILNGITDKSLLGNFIDRLRLMIITALKFMLSEPRLNSLYLEFMKEKQEFRREVISKLRNSAPDYMKILLEEAIRNREIREDVGTQTIEVFLEAALNGLNSLIAYIKDNAGLEKYVTDYIKLIEEAIKIRS